MVIGGLNILETDNLLGFLHAIISRVYREWSIKEIISTEQQFSGPKCLFDARGQRKNVMILEFCCDIQMVGRQQPENMDPSCLISTVQAAGGDVMVWGIFFLAHSVSILLEYCCQPCPSLHDHSVPSSDEYFEEEETRHVTKLKLS